MGIIGFKKYRLSMSYVFNWPELFYQINICGRAEFDLI